MKTTDGSDIEIRQYEDQYILLKVTQSDGQSVSVVLNTDESTQVSRAIGEKRWNILLNQLKPIVSDLFNKLSFADDKRE
jgi:hypothetical protein